MSPRARDTAQGSTAGKLSLRDHKIGEHRSLRRSWGPDLSLELDALAVSNVQDIYNLIPNLYKLGSLCKGPNSKRQCAF